MTKREKQLLRCERALARLSWERLTLEQIAYWRRMLDDARRQMREG